MKRGHVKSTPIQNKKHKQKQTAKLQARARERDLGWVGGGSGGYTTSKVSLTHTSPKEDY